MAHRSRWCARSTDERGAMAVLVALLAVVLFGVAALAVDISSLSMERQSLHNQVDAAAHAGAFELPDDGEEAIEAAKQMAAAQDVAFEPAVDLWCVVAATEDGAVKATQIPGTCDPGDPAYTVANYPGMRCNTVICALPCVPGEGDVCNTLRVAEDKRVDFSFAPAIGVEDGGTGSVTSVACKGSCGDAAPNPLDVLVMADRTTSMSDANREQMKAAILDSLQVMSPALHYVAFGTLHKSRVRAGKGDWDDWEDWDDWKDWDCVTAASTKADGVTGGTWVPVEFTNDYLQPDGSGELNRDSELVQGVSCLPDGTVPGYSLGTYGTHLAGAMKGAARYLLGFDENNLDTLPERPGEARKVLIFESDGKPDEILEGGSTDLSTPGDVGAGRNFSGNDNGVEGCDNLVEVANQAKQEGVLVVMIGFGDANRASCKRGSNKKPRVRDHLAAAASPTADGRPSVADSDCGEAWEREHENSDGDYYFCAAEGEELASIFVTAVSAVGDGIRFLELP